MRVAELHVLMYVDRDGTLRARCTRDDGTVTRCSGEFTELRLGAEIALLERRVWEGICDGCNGSGEYSNGEKCRVCKGSGKA